MSKVRIQLEIDETVYRLLHVLTHAGFGVTTVQGVIESIIDHMQQGVYRPGSWERPVVESMFGQDWQEYLQVGDPYGRPDSPMFQRPIPDDGAIAGAVLVKETDATAARLLDDILSYFLQACGPGEDARQFENGFTISEAFEYLMKARREYPDLPAFKTFALLASWGVVT